jgi:hypothetical protein
LTTGIAATCASILHNDALAWVTVASVLVLVIRMRWFGYYELSLVQRAVSRAFHGMITRLFSFQPGRRPPDATELAGLPCDRVWSMLIGEVQAWNVCRMELVLSGQHDWPAKRCWAAPRWRIATESCWSLAIAFRKRDGKYCELRAEIPDVAGPEFLYLTGLTRVLKEFGTRFAEELEIRSPLLPHDGDEAGAGWVHKIRHRAA